jgi:hypothetical protein
MNTTFINIIKQIVAQEGEAILGNPARLKVYVSKYAKNEKKEIRLAFGRCIEQGYYRVLKQTSAADERQEIKPKIAQQMHNISKLPLEDCTEAVDILEAVIYGEQAVLRTQNSPKQPLKHRFHSFSKKRILALTAVFIFFVKKNFISFVV